jgi:hypothetical protein
VLDPESVVDLLQQVRVSADFLGVNHTESIDDSSVPGNGSSLHTTTEPSTGGNVMITRQ